MVEATSVPEGNVFQCCFGQIKWTWKHSLVFVLGIYLLGFTSGVAFRGTISSTPDGKDSGGSGEDDDDQGDRKPQLLDFKDSSPSSEASGDTLNFDVPGDSGMKPLQGTYFQDASCVQSYNVSYQSTRAIEKDYEDAEPILLWIHTYSPNNAPPVPDSATPFDDPPPKNFNTGHISFQKGTDQHHSSWFSLPHHIRSHPIILALTTYGAMHWTIDTTSITLSRVISTGFQQQRVTVKHNETTVPVELFWYGSSMQQFPGLPTLWPGWTKEFAGKLRGYKESIEKHTGTSVYWYGFCYGGSQVAFPRFS